jgi:hypothetical protein
MQEQFGIPNGIYPRLQNSKIHFDESLASFCKDFDLFATQYEICDNHGVGVLLKRLFGESKNIINIRVASEYGGKSIGSIQIELKHTGRTRCDSYMAVGDVLRFCSVKRIICVPYLPDDAINAIAAGDIFNAPICLYLMDDQNITTQGIPDDLMRELIEKARVRFAIGPELRNAYEKKYGRKFWLLPPTAPCEYINDTVITPLPEKPAQLGVLLGNIWSQAWLDDLKKMIRESGMTIHWFGNTAVNRLLSYDEADLAKDGLHIQGFIDDDTLQQRLRTYAYAIVPSGSTNEYDTHQWQAELSLPSRIPYLMSTANIPIIVLAVKDTPATNFVRRFDIGAVCDYTAENFRRTVDAICTPEAQQKYRSNAAAVARNFSSEGIADWIWKSLELGRPCDEKYERLFGHAGETASR